jgi:signal transduction histidine kinase
MNNDPAAQSIMQPLVQIVQELSLTRSIEAVTAIVRRAARELTGADGATFILRENQDCYYVDEDAISPLWKGQRFPSGNCISGWVMLNKQPVAIEDIYADDRIPHEIYRPTFVRSLVMVPIRTIDPIGAIGNYWATRHTPTAGQIQILQALADITAVAIGNISLYTELERRVNERTAELSAVKASMEAFSYSISHDLRAPLRSIRGFVEILLENLHDKIGPPEQKTADRITRNVDRMEKLIDGLLQFSQLGQRKVLRTTVSMYKMAAETWLDCKPENSRQIAISIADLPDARADETLIRQVWTNLISNAIKYTGKRTEAVIEIGYYASDDGVVYFVRDNGAGFDMAYAYKLFEMFQRLHLQHEFEGIGVGLSLVQRIILKHEGKIWAEGEVDRGATFYFSLPGN